MVKRLQFYIYSSNFIICRCVFLFINFFTAISYVNRHSQQNQSSSSVHCPARVECKLLYKMSSTRYIITNVNKCTLKIIALRQKIFSFTIFIESAHRAIRSSSRNVSGCGFLRPGTGACAPCPRTGACVRRPRLEP